MSFFYLIIRKGMTGGTARSVYKMLCETPGWEDQPSNGCLDFESLGVITHTLCWEVKEASSQQEADANVKFINSQSAKNGYDAFCISFEEAMRIEKGEKVEESPGTLLAETVEKIREVYLRKKEAGEETPGVMIMTKEEFEKMIKGKNES